MADKGVRNRPNGCKITCAIKIRARRRKFRVEDDRAVRCARMRRANNACQNFIRVSRVTEVNSKVTDKDALVTAEVEMVVLSPFAACSPIASGCTGTCWDLRTGKAAPATQTRDSFAVAHRVRIEKSFAFQKIAGGWRCTSAGLQPVDLGIALSGP